MGENATGLQLGESAYVDGFGDAAGGELDLSAYGEGMSGDALAVAVGVSVGGVADFGAVSGRGSSPDDESALAGVVVFGDLCSERVGAVIAFADVVEDAGIWVGVHGAAIAGGACAVIGA